MEDHWKGRNVNLSILTDSIHQFFVENRYVSSINKSNGEHEIVVHPKTFHDIVEDISVKIDGQPNDFSIKFITSSRSRSFVVLGALATMFGAGFLTLKGLKSREALEKLQKVFWIYVDKKIWELTDSGES
jgi:hypothetical protein